MSGISGESFTMRQIQLIAVCTTCLILSTTAVGLRLLVRFIATAARPWWDDWVVILALLTSWLVNIFTLLGIHNGLGRHAEELNKSQAIPFGVTVWLQQICWALSMGLIITAILLFYLRIFPNRWLRRSVYGIGACFFAWTIATTLVYIFQCRPVEYFWDRESEGGSCIDANRAYFATGLISSVTLVVVLLLPLPIVWKLQISYPRKIGLGLSFSIGAFVCASSVVRLVVLLLIKPGDLDYTSALPQLWSCVEVSFGVIGACIPSLTPIFIFLFAKIPISIKHYSSSLSSYKKSRRTRKNTRSNFRRMVDVGITNPQNQSLELIVRGGANSAGDIPRVEAQGSRGDGMRFVGLGERDIVVTREIDQSSRDRSEETQKDDQSQMHPIE